MDADTTPEIPVPVNGQGGQRFRRSHQAVLLIHALEQISVGGRISYAELSQACGTDVQKRPYLLKTARNALWQHRFFFQVETGVGLYRVNDAECVDLTGAKAERRIYNLSRRTARQLAVIEREELPDEAAKSSLDVYLTTFGLVKATTDPKGQAGIKSLCDSQGYMASLADAARKLAEIV